MQLWIGHVSRGLSPADMWPTQCRERRTLVRDEINSWKDRPDQERWPISASRLMYFAAMNWSKTSTNFLGKESGCRVVAIVTTHAYGHCGVVQIRYADQTGGTLDHLVARSMTARSSCSSTCCSHHFLLLKNIKIMMWCNVTDTISWRGNQYRVV